MIQVTKPLGQEECFLSLKYFPVEQLQERCWQAQKGVLPSPLYAEIRWLWHEPSSGWAQSEEPNCVERSKGFIIVLADLLLIFPGDKKECINILYSCQQHSPLWTFHQADLHISHFQIFKEKKGKRKQNRFIKFAGVLLKVKTEIMLSPPCCQYEY